MNSSFYSNLNQTKLVERDIFLVINDILGYYIIPINAFISLIVNLFFCSLIYTLDQQSRFYNLLLCKQLMEAAGGLIGVAWQNFHCTFCNEQIFNTYTFHFVRIYLVRYPVSIIFNDNLIFEFLLSYERYCSINNEKSVINKIPVKYLFLLISMVFIILYIPDYLAIYIDYTGKDNIYSYSYTESVGKTNWYSIYFIIYMLSVYIFSLSSLITFNVLLVKGYRKFMSRKQKITASSSRHQKSITKIIVITNTFYTIIRILHFVSLCIFKLNTINGDFYLPSTNLLRAFAYWLLYINYTCILLVYLVYDKNIQRQFKKKIKFW